MGDIFQDLATSLNVSYVSDMQKNVTYEEVAAFAMSVPEDSYTMSSWNEVLEYVFDRRHKYRSIDEIRSLHI